MSRSILVTGAPGNVGTEVVKALTGKAEFRIGAFDTHLAQRVLGEVAEYVHFDFLIPATFAPTFAGIEKMFLVRPPALSNVKRDIVPALSAAKQAGVKHIVFLSIQGVEQNRMVPHFKIEAAIRELGFKYTFLRASFFMENLSTTHQAEIRDRNQIAVPVGKAKTSFVDVRDLGAVAARALTEPGYVNKLYTLTGSEALDYQQVATILTASLGRTIRYTRPSVIGFVAQQLRQGSSIGLTVVMAGLYTITRFGNASEVTQDVQTLLGRPPILFKQFVNDYRAAWIPQAAS